MSSAEAWRIGLAPRRVELVRWRPGLTARPPHRANLIDATARDIAGPGSIAAALAALDELSAARPEAARISVVLSSHFVHFALLPWQDELLRPAELAIAARHCFERIHGDRAAAWQVRHCQPAFGQPWIASAVDRGLLDGLAQRLDKDRRRLIAVQPALIAACNTHRANGAGGVVVVEPGRLGIATFAGGQWQSIAARRYITSETGAARRALRQELARLAAPPATSAIVVLPLGAGLAGSDATDPAGHDFILHPPPGAGIAPCPLALCGIA